MILKETENEQESWTPWHKVVEMRDDLKSGELALSIFAADLYDVVMEKAKPVYQDLHEFFSLTYPTYNLRVEKGTLVPKQLDNLINVVGLFSLHSICLVHDFEKTKPHLSLRNGVPSLQSM